MNRHLLLAVALVVAASAVPSPTFAATAVSQPRPSSKPVAGPVTEAADEPAARAAARQNHRRVEVTSERTEKTRVFANPSSTITVEEHSQPVLVRLGGGWAAVDTTLHLAPDGTVRPGVTKTDLVISGGGDGPLVRLAYGGRDVSFGWPARLNTPTLAGDTATYAEVLPGVDLAVSATADGFSELLIVKTRQAALNPALARVKFTVATKGVNLGVAAGGGLVATDGSGATVFSAGAPSMWDTAAATDIEPHRAGVGLELARGALSVLPDARMLADPNMRFPLTIDPSVALGLRQWGNVTANAPNQGIAADPFRPDGAKAGHACDQFGCYTYRSLFAFWAGAIHGKHILNATFAATLYHSWSCSDTPVELWLTGGINDGSSWNNTSWWRLLDTRSGHASNGCGGPIRMEFGNGLAGAVQDASNGAWSDVTVGLKAPNEGDVYQWKRFYADATLSVEYNTAPNQPVALDTQGKGCTTGAGRPYLATLTPQLAAYVGDWDAGQVLSAGFEYWQTGGGYVGTVWQNNVGNGSWARVNVAAGALSDGGTYSWRVTATDGIDWSPWSAWCEFTVDVTPPNPAKLVVSTDYPADGNFHGAVGRTGRFTLVPPDTHPEDVAEYLVGLNQCNQPSCALSVAAAADHSAGVDLTPNLDGRNTLSVWTRDRAGNLGDILHPLTYSFLVRSGTGPAVYLPMSEGSGSTTADATGHGNTLNLVGGVQWASGRSFLGNAIMVDGSTGYGATSGTVQARDPDSGSLVPFRTDHSYTVAAWVQPSTVNGTGTYPTALGMDGNRNSPFFLRYSWGPNPRWRFDVTQSDDDQTPLPVAVGTTPVASDVWTYVAGTYDSSTNTIRLYVNGVEEGSATIAGTFNATGPLTVGRAKWQGQLNHFFNGTIGEVRVWDRVASAGELQALARPLAPRVSGGTGAVAGRPVQLSISAGWDANVTSYQYSLDDASLSATASPAIPGDAVTVTVTPTSVDTHTLYAIAVDARGRHSDVASVDFQAVAEPMLSGRVTSASTGAPMAGVPITINRPNLRTTTASDGTYSFTGLNPGTATLTAWSGDRCGMSGSRQVTIAGGPFTADLALRPLGDGFGYTCTEATTPFVPADATVLTLPGVTGVQKVDLPFAMPFYGQGYSAAWVDINGLVAFVDPRATHWKPTSLPNAAPPTAMVAAFWGNVGVDPSTTVRTATIGAAPNQQFVVEWRNLSLGDNSSALMSFEVILGQNGDITLNYHGIPADNVAEQGGEASVGIENSHGSDGVGYSFNEPVMTDNHAITFHYPGAQHPSPLWSISGTLKDGASGAPVAGASVSLAPTGVTTATDAAGSYTFANLEAGSYTLSSSGSNRCASSVKDTINVSAAVVHDLVRRPLTDGYYGCAEAPTPFVPADATVLPLTGNQEITLPFPVSFYGQQYSSAWFRADGYLAFADPGLYYHVPAMPNPSPPNAVVAPFWGELVVDSQASVRTAVLGAAPNRQFVVEWRNVRLWADPSARLSFEVILSENGDITFNYSGLDSPDKEGYLSVVGLETADGKSGLVWSDHEAALSDHNALTFRH